MSESLNPERVYQDLISNKISKRDALKLFESILSKSDIEEDRYKTIEFLNTLSFEKDKVYNLLESCLISDESATIRAASATILTEKFIEYDLSPLLWAIESENSISFFKYILDTIENQKTANSEIIYQKILTKLSNHYKLDNNDAIFILDIEYLDYLRFKSEFDIFLKNFSLNEAEIQERIKENSQLGYKGLARIKKFSDGHILALNLKDLEEIPGSICKLEKLNSLEISLCKLKKSPDYCKNLESLDSLVMVNNQLEFLPNWLINYAKREIKTQFYTNKGVLPFEAYILVILEVVSGHECIKIDQKPIIENSVTVCYRLNNKGSLIGLYYANSNYKIGILPKELCELRSLEDLHLSNQNIKSIPSCLRNLDHLKTINLSKNQITELPSELCKLKNLDLIDFRDNPLNHIPEALKDIPQFKF